LLPQNQEQILILPNELWLTFPMMDKVSVKGDDMCEVCISFDTKIKKTDYKIDVEWNFQST
jgi:glutathione peroxidase